MNKFFTLLVLSFTIFSLTYASDSSDKTIIIQFRGNDFEKKIPEIVSNFKSLKGISYLSHCTAQNLFVMKFDLLICGETLVEKSVKEKIPVGLVYDFKEGTIEEMKNNFGNCLIEESFKYETK